MDRELVINEILKIPTDWKELCYTYRDSILDISPTLKDKQIYPSLENIFRCFHYFNINETRVVILGQDPYHGPNQATGLCFDIDKKQKKIPPSLRNIYKVLGKNADLETWAKQGVLMLNASLTVYEKLPNSHVKSWFYFTKNIINFINKYCENIVFVAWGAFALNTFQDIDTNKHKLLVCSHPSPLSCNRTLHKIYPSFMLSDIFNKINCSLENDANKIIW